jgi:hypothetical protein
MSCIEKYSGSTTLTTILVGLEAAAQALNLTADELSAEFCAGKTLAQLADEQGADMTRVQQAIHEAVKAEPRAAIQQALNNGILTQDNADWLLLGLEKDYWGAGQLFSSGFYLGRSGLGRLSIQAANYFVLHHSDRMTSLSQLGY